MTKTIFKTLSVSIFIAAIFFQSNLAYAADPACTTSGGVITRDLVNSNISIDCTIRPEIQTISVRRLQLCWAKPTGPTTFAKAVVSNCSNTVFGSKTLAQQVTINEGSASPLSDITKPSANNYTWVYLELDPTIKLKSKAQWSGAMVGAAGGAGGDYCWSTNPTTLYMHGFNLGGGTFAAKCGATHNEDGSYDTTTFAMNSLTYDTFVTSAVIAQAETFLNIGPIYLYLVNSAGILIEGGGSGKTNITNGVSKIIAIWQQKVTVTAAGINKTTGLKINYLNSAAADPHSTIGEALNTVSAFVPNKFDMYISTTPATPYE